MTPAAIKAIRHATGLSQMRFALRYRIATCNVQSWEQGRRTPEPGALLLLKLIGKYPDELSAMIATLPAEFG